MLHTILSIIYVIALIYTAYRIIMDTDSPSKAIAYLLMIILLPVVGIVLYYSIGVNHRVKGMYAKKLDTQGDLTDVIPAMRKTYNIAQEEQNLDQIGHFKKLVHFIGRQGGVSSGNNTIKLLHNGDNKFPQLFEDLRNAQDHIHMEYYIYEDDDTGNQVADILIERAQAGVTVRFMYDDFGSKLKKSFIKRLQDGGVEVFPFYKIQFRPFANHLNYRNHRKIVVIDGNIGFVGGINVSNKYINDKGYDNPYYWRDTHIRMEGPTVMNLQFIFLTDWNFASQQNVMLIDRYFPLNMLEEQIGDKFAQVSYSGPDSTDPYILFSMIEAIGLAEEQVLLTTPYFIPDKSFMDALKIAKESGIDVKIIVPGKSDSWLVNSIAESNYGELLDIGIKIYRYQRGFIHAKTMVVDGRVTNIGTANMDERSFNLNFEVNAVIYNDDFGALMQQEFVNDLKDCIEIDPAEWARRPKSTVFIQKLLRLGSPLM